MLIYIIRTTMVSLVSMHLSRCFHVCISRQCISISVNRLKSNYKRKEIPTFENYRISNFYRVFYILYKILTYVSIKSVLCGTK